MKRSQRKHIHGKRSHLVRDIIEIIAITCVIFVAIHFAMQSYYVDGVTMQPLLDVNESVMVNKTAYLFHAPERGDVIVFHFPLDTSRNYIKRVIGLPGDTIVMDNTHVSVNGVQLVEPYVKNPYNPQGATFVVPADQYFVMGDNRQYNDDSRSWGAVPRSYIIGKAVMVFWPILHMRFLNTYPDVFKNIKSPRSK